MRKIFWALFVVGCGFNVHAVEETSTKTINAQKLNTGDAEMIGTVVRPTSVEQVDNMFEKAANKGDVELMERLIQEVSEDRKVTAQTVGYAFDRAASRGDVKVMEWFLKRVPDKVTAQTVESAFGYAASRGDPEVMDWLLNNVPDKVTEKTVENIFNRAASRGDPEVMDWFLKRVPDKVTEKTVENIFNPAASHGRVEVMNWLLNNVPDKVTVKTVESAFGYAASRGRVEVMSWLLREVPEGRKVTQQTVAIAFKHAVKHRHTKTVKYLLSQGHVNIDQQVLQSAFNELVSRMDLTDLAEFHFPKKVYENSKDLSARLNQNPLSEEGFKRIMAIRTTDDRNSPFAEYILERFVDKKNGISSEKVKTLLLDPYFQDAMALMKLRQQGTNKVSKLPKDVFQYIVKRHYQPGILKLKTDEGASKE